MAFNVDTLQVKSRLVDNGQTVSTFLAIHLNFVKPPSFQSSTQTLDGDPVSVSETSGQVRPNNSSICLRLPVFLSIC